MKKPLHRIPFGCGKSQRVSTAVGCQVFRWQTLHSAVGARFR